MSKASVAIPFLTASSEDGKYMVNEEAVEILNRIEGPVAVVAVAGLWRTGKSFLLNSLLGLNGQKESFVVGNTINACTKGLWLWGEPLVLADGLTVIFMDSEGLGSTSRTQTEDCQIFSLAVLLSSYFIWNSRGVIDGNALDDIGLVMNLSKQIALGGNKGTATNASLSDYFPTFMWVVRDFTLRLEKNGREIDDMEYLEDALKLQHVNSDNGGMNTRNEIRKTLSQYFKSRDCTTLVRPAEDENTLRSLNSVPLEKLRPNFVKALENLKKKVFSKIKCKYIHGKPMNGSMLSTLAMSYSEALNKGGVPTIDTAWQRVLVNQTHDSTLKAEHVYLTQLIASLKENSDPNMVKDISVDRFISLLDSFQSYSQVKTQFSFNITNQDVISSLIPLDKIQLEEIHVNALKLAMRAFHEKLQGSSDSAIASNSKLRERLTQRRSLFFAMNHFVSFKFCSSLTVQLIDTMMNIDDHDLESTAVVAASTNIGSTPSTNSTDHQGASFSFKSKCDAFVKEFESKSKGTAKFEVLSKIITSNFITLQTRYLQRYIAFEKRNIKKGRNELNMLSERAEGICHKYKVELEAANKEREQLTRSKEIVEKDTKHECDIESNKLAMRQSELEKSNEQIEKLEEAFDFCLDELNTMLKNDEAIVEDLQKTYKQLMAQSQDHHQNPSTHSQSLIGDNDIDDKIMLCRREVDLFQQHVEGLQKEISSTTDLIQAKESEISEREFQWGMAKAGIAHEEGEAMTLEEEIDVLRCLTKKLKSFLQNRLTGSLPSDLIKELQQDQVAALNFIK